jgi:rubrerythrin
MEKLLEHWLKHNSDHIGTYRQWSQKAKESGLNDISVLLEDIASASLALNDKFEEAAKLLKKEQG